MVTGFELSPLANSVQVYVTIYEPYDRIVRTNTRFWNVSGIGMEIGLLGGKIKTESLQALLEGGIAFATPDRLGETVVSGIRFELHENPQSGWLDWDPEIPLTVEEEAVGAEEEASREE